MNLNTMFGRMNQRTINPPTSQNIIPNPNIRNPNANRTSSIGLMSMNYRKEPPVAHEVPKINMVNSNAVASTATMKWGQPTWFFFHTLAEKIFEDRFPEIRQPLLDLIYSICVNLPCPDCANHAKTYLDGINFHTIQTKNDL